MSKLRSSVVITFLSTNGSTVINFGVGLVLARLLSPADVGVFSITSVLVAIAHIFRDFGVSDYLLREKDLSSAKVSAAFGVLLTSSWGIAAGLYLLSDVAALYFKEPGVGRVMPVLALGFMVIPFGAITHTLLTRELKAKEQAQINVFGTLAYAGSSIVFALLGFGYMSLAWANLVNIVTTALACLPFRPAYAPWRPSFHGWRSIASFGTGSILGNSITALNNALSDIFLGKTSGAYAVGIYSRANGTASILMQVLGPTLSFAALPHLAKAYHANGNIERQLGVASAYLSAIAWPVLGMSAVYSRDIILILYGERWLESAPLVPLTCAIVAVAVSTNFLTTALTAIGRPYVAVVPAMAILVARIGVVALVFDGTLLSFGWAMLCGSLLALPVSLVLQSRFLNLSILGFCRAQAGSVAVTVLTCGAGWAVHLWTPTTWAAGLRMAVMVPVCAAAWVASVWLLRHPLADELRLAVRRRLGAPE